MFNRFTTALLLTVLYTLPAKAGHEAGNGGIGIVTERGLIVLDSIEHKDEFLPPDMPAFKYIVAPRLRTLSQKLPKTSAYLQKFFREVGHPRWYFARYQVKPTSDQGPTVNNLTMFEKKQIAYNNLEEVYVQSHYWNMLSLYDQSVILMHEVIWIALGYQPEDASVVRRIVARVMSRFNYLPDVSTQSLVEEFKRIITDFDSPLLKVLLEDAAQAEAGELKAQPTANGGLKEFVERCVNASPEDLELLAALAFEKISSEDPLNSRFRSFQKPSVFSADDCKGIYRFGKNQSSLKLKKTVELSRRPSSEATSPEFQRINELLPRRSIIASFAITRIDLLTFFDNLREISLSNTKVSDLSPLRALSSLKSLTVTGNQVQELDIAEGFSALELLDLSDNEIETVKNLNLPSLKSLNLDGNFLDSSFTLTKPLQELAVLSLARNQIKDFNRFDLDLAPNLKRLVLRDNTLENLNFVERAPGLISLDVSGNDHLRLRDLRILESLEELRLAEIGLTHLTVDMLPPNLAELDLRGNQLGEINFRDALNLLTKLDLTGNDLVSIKLSNSLQSLSELDWQGMTHLEAFEISGNALQFTKSIRIQGSKLSTFSGCLPNLGKLDLSPAPRLQHIAQLEAPLLKSINLAGSALRTLNSLSKDAFPMLSEIDVSKSAMVQLETVDPRLQLTTLKARSIGLRDLSKFPEIPTLRSLDVSDNPLTSLAGIEKNPYIFDLFVAGTDITSLEPIPRLHFLRNLDLTNSYSLIKAGQYEGFDLVGKGEQVYAQLRNLSSLKLLKLSPAYTAIIYGNVSERKLSDSILVIILGDWPLKESPLAPLMKEHRDAWGNLIRLTIEVH